MASLGNDCGTWDKADTTYITASTTADEISAWVQNVDTEVGDNTFGAFDKVGERIAQLLKEIQTIESLALTDSDHLKLDDQVKCPSDTPASCTYNDIRLNDIKKFETLALSLQKDFEIFLGSVGGYVDNLLLPTLDSFINDATAINDHGNCQFQGTALRQAAMVSMCETTMPAAGMCMVWSAVVSVACFLLSIHSWGWYHYFADLERHEGSSFEAMSSAKEYVAYTGYPSSAAHRETGVMIRNYNGSPVLMQPAGVHVSVMPSGSLASSSYVTCDLSDRGVPHTETKTQDQP